MLSRGKETLHVGGSHHLVSNKRYNNRYCGYIGLCKISSIHPQHQGAIMLNPSFPEIHSLRPHSCPVGPVGSRNPNMLVLDIWNRWNSIVYCCIGVIHGK